MTDISEADEREAVGTVESVIRNQAPGYLQVRHARTLLALLDRQVMPKPEDVPDEALLVMWRAWGQCTGTGDLKAAAAYRALYDHYNKPPAPDVTTVIEEKPRAVDAELAALPTVFNALAPLDKDARARVLVYMTRCLVAADHDH